MSVQSAASQDALQSGFQDPPSAAKARTWWHWVNGNVSKEGITADLEAMKRVGIQEAQVFNVDFGYPEGPATFLSPEWLTLFKFAATEAKRLGMELAFNNGPGWSSSGGPWVTPENGMQTVVYSQTEIKGGHVLTRALPAPPSKLNYYKDIAVIAFPTPKDAVRINELDLKSLSGQSFRTHLWPSDKTVDASARIPKNKIIDLTRVMSKDGTLKWNAPAGDWTILRFGHTPMGTENHPTGSTTRGLEIDKMSSAAVDAYWQGGIQPILDNLGPLVGKTVTGCLIDSYEVGCNNWTENFREEFKKRRGYDLIRFLPALAGYYVESGEISERFLWDFRKTVSDLMVDNYYGHFQELCHKHGLRFSVEPYGGPFDDLQAGSTGDIVMGEFWVGKNIFLESPKLAASVAHLSGHSIVGAESFTSFGGWLNHPATLKQIGDQVWTEGVNRFMFHSYVHQPWNKGPGLTFETYGIEMNRLNTWWEQSKAYMDYIARSQFLLQQGKSFADVLVFSDESAPNDAIMRPDIKALGYDYDQIGSAALQTLTVKDGKLYTPSGGTYRLLILPATQWATPDLLLKIKKLVLGGAVVKIAGTNSSSRPQKSPSLTGYPACDAKVAALADQLWDNQRFMSDAGSIKEVFKQLNLVPDFAARVTGTDLNFIHRVAGNDDIYFVANPQKSSRNEFCSFRVTGKTPQLWNPETGIIRDVPVWQQNTDSTTDIPLSFTSNGSVFVVFRGGKASASATGHIMRARSALKMEPIKPLPGLKILKAQYGVFLPEGMQDVTAVLKERITKDGIQLSADNGLTSGDPAAGSVKELRVAYELNGQRQELRLLENEHRFINTDKKEFKLIRALYGKFPQGFGEIPPVYPIDDVTKKIQDFVEAGRLSFPVSDSLLGIRTDLPKFNGAKELRIDYLTQGETNQVAIQNHRLVHLEVDRPEPRLETEKDGTTWVTPYEGKLEYILTGGALKSVAVREVPAPIELSGSWDVSFPGNLGAPTKAVFPELTSWSLFPDKGVRYFSGTATYKKQFTLQSDVLKADNSLELDLGSVGVIAEVILNGQNLGVLWKAPFRVDLGKAVHKGINILEIRVTNLWPNRLIGDEQMPDDIKWHNGIPEKWPDWLSGKDAVRHSKRIAFATYKHWDKDAKLQLSGLLGPVIIRIYRHVRLAE